MHEDIQELQEQLEEAGLFADGQSEENFENEFKKNGLKIPGKKVFKILKKQLKKQKTKIKDGTGKLKNRISKSYKDKKKDENEQPIEEVPEQDENDDQKVDQPQENQEQPKEINFSHGFDGNPVPDHCPMPQKTQSQPN